MHTCSTLALIASGKSPCTCFCPPQGESLRSRVRLGCLQGAPDPGPPRTRGRPSQWKSPERGASLLASRSSRSLGPSAPSGTSPCGQALRALPGGEEGAGARAAGSRPPRSRAGRARNLSPLAAVTPRRPEPFFSRRAGAGRGGGRRAEPDRSPGGREGARRRRKLLTWAGREGGRGCGSPWRWISRCCSGPASRP